MIELLLTFALSLVWAAVIVIQSYLHSHERKAHRQECRELANRIQRPEWTPAVASDELQVSSVEPDAEWARVGTIEIE